MSNKAKAAGPERGVRGLLAGMLLGLGLGLSPSASATPTMLAWDQAETQTAGPSLTLTAGPSLTLTSPAMRPGAPMPQTYTAYGKNISPPLAWSGAPPATKALVLIVEDVDSTDPRPATHWLAYNIPPTAASLSRGVRNIGAPTSPLGMLQGWNYHGSLGYSGPRPPVGDPAHHYVFQLFAVNQTLRLRSGARLPDVIRAINGRVIARGRLVALYAEPAPKEPPATP